MPMPFYSLPITSFDSGEWLMATVSDDGTPLGDAFPVGAPVFIRNAEGNEYHVLLLDPKPVRRFLTGTQVVNFTEGNYPVAPNQEELSQQWEAMDPPHAGFIRDGVPRFYKYKRVTIVDSTPIVSQKNWEADWDRGVIYLEERNLDPPIPLSPEERQQDIDDCLEHESTEHDLSYAEASNRAPYASPEDLDRLAEELQGLMHAQTIGEVEGFTGPGAEEMYYLAFKQLMVKKGFEKDVATWSNVTV